MLLVDKQHITENTNTHAFALMVKRSTVTVGARVWTECPTAAATNQIKSKTKSQHCRLSGLGLVWLWCTCRHHLNIHQNSEYEKRAQAIAGPRFFLVGSFYFRRVFMFLWVIDWFAIIARKNRKSNRRTRTHKFSHMDFYRIIWMDKNRFHRTIYIDQIISSFGGIEAEWGV